MMLGLLCLAALGLRLLTLSQYESNHPLVEAPSIDERSYDEWAVEIAAGDWLGDAVRRQLAQRVEQAWRLAYYLGSAQSGGRVSPWGDPVRSPEAFPRTGFRLQAILPNS